MAELAVIAVLMGAVSAVFTIAAGIIQSFHKSKAFNLLCGGLCFVVAIAFGSLAILRADSASLIAFGLYFILGSLKIAQAALAK